MDRLELARRLFGDGVEGTSTFHPAETQTYIGTAVSDSADGLVRVDIGNSTTEDGEEGIEVATTVSVKEGEEVYVTAVGGTVAKSYYVSGVVGLGDETNSRITAIETDYVKATMLEADLAEIGVLTADSAVISELQAETAKVENVTASQLEASTAYIGALQTGNVTAQNIIADKAKLAQIDTAQISADHAVINTLDSNYAKIDLANVSNAWIDDGVIRDAAIGDAQIADISANKLTAGTINGSVINVTNLNATNITTGTINGQRLGEGSIALSKLSESVYTEGEVDSIVSNLNDRIDSAIETYTATAVPTLSNYPASSWDTDDERAEHVGDICYVLNAGSETDGYTYRFAYDNSTGTYQWVLIKDNQVTAALQRLVDAEGDIDGLQSFQSDTSVWISDTDEALNVIRTNHTSLTTVVNKTIVETVQLWYSKANTTAPAKPTSQVTSTSTSGGAWRTVVPSYSTSYPNYFYCYQWKYADGTYGWSSVTRDIAMGEAQSTSRTAASNASTAITNAFAAQTTADGAATAASNAQATANSNIKSSVQLWYSKDNETAPSKPTAQVTSTSTSGNGWRTVVPTYSSSYPYYYYCYQYQMGDGTYKWSDVVYDRATTESQSTARATASSLSNYITTNDGALAALKSQVDGQLEVWYGNADPTASNLPASGWDSDQKTAHSGDLYYNVSDGTVWQWSGSSWTELPDDAAAAALNAAQDAQATADGKRRIFTTTPTVPYDIGDLWVTGNEVRYATVKKSSSQSYSASDWSQTATDDTAANNAQATADKNVKTSIQLWYTKDNETPPAKPSAKVTSNSTSGGGWRIVVPSYNASYPKYFYCYQYELADGTYTWSDVVFDRATTENEANAHSALTQLTTKVDTQTFNDLTDTVSEHTRDITTLTTTTQQMTQKVEFIEGDYKPNVYHTTDGTQGTNGIFHLATITVNNTYVSQAIALTCMHRNSSKTEILIAFNNANSTDPGISFVRYTGSRVVYMDRESAGVYRLWVTKAEAYDSLSVTEFEYGSYTSARTSWEWTSDQVSSVEGLNEGYVTGQQLADGQLSSNFATSSQLTIVSNTVNTVSQKADSNLAKISNLTTTLGTNADGTTNVNDIVHRESALEQDLDGFKATVSETYATKDALSAETTARTTAIQQTTEAIALKANSSDVYTKSATDGLISTEVTNRNAAIQTATDGIRSEVSETYATKTEVTQKIDNISVGGRNLIWDSTWKSTNERWNAWGAAGTTTREIVEIDGKRWLHIASSTQYQGWQQAPNKRNGSGELVAGEEVTLSFVARTASPTSVSVVGFHWLKYNESGVASIVSQSWNAWTIPVEATRFKRTYTVPSEATGFNVMVGSNIAADVELWVADLKLEKGNVATDWTPAPEDMATGAQLTTVSNTVNIVSQKANSNLQKISNLTTTLGTNADGTTNVNDIVHRESALEQDLDGFKATVSETYATKTEVRRTDAGSGTVVSSDDAANLPPLSLTIHGKSVQDGTPTPSAPVPIRSVESANLQPYFSHDLSDVYDATTNPNGYWCGLAETFVTHATQLSDGWVNIYADNTGGSGTWYMNFNVVPNLSFAVDTNYVFIVEIRNLETTLNSSGNGAALFVSSGNSDGFKGQFSASVSTGAIKRDGIYRIVSRTRASYDGVQTFSRSFISFDKGSKASFDFRISVFEESNYAAYQPYGEISVNASGRNIFEGPYLDGAINTTTGAITASNLYNYVSRMMYVTNSAATIMVEDKGEYGGSINFACYASDGAFLGFCQPLYFGGMTPPYRHKMNLLTNTASIIATGYYASGAALLNTAKVAIYDGDVDYPYEPYSPVDIPIPLQGNAARSLSDGMEDVLKVDSEGNVTLTKMVGEVTYDGSESWGVNSNVGSGFAYTPKPADMASGDGAASVQLLLADRFVPKSASTGGNVYASGSNLLFYRDGSSFNPSSTAEAKAWFAANPTTVIYKLATPQTISLGKIDLPSLPSPSFSMHVDAAASPTLDAEWWTHGGEEVGTIYQRTSALEQTSQGFTIRMDGIDGDLSDLNGDLSDLSGDLSNLSKDAVLKSKDKWTAWMDVGTDDNNDPYLTMGQSGNAFESRLTNRYMSFNEGTVELMRLSGEEGVKADTIRSKYVYIGSWILEQLDNGDMAIKLVGGE